MFSPHYKQLSWTPITPAKYCNLHTLRQQNKQHNTEHLFINTTNMEIQKYSGICYLYLLELHVRWRQREQAPAKHWPTYTNHHSATFQMIWIVINTAERTIEILRIWNNNNQHNNKRTAKNLRTISRQCQKAKSSSCCISIKQMADVAGGI